MNAQSILQSMSEHIRRGRTLSADEVASLRAARADFDGRPTKAELLASGQFAGPMSIDEYLAWRKGLGETPVLPDENK